MLINLSTEEKSNNMEETHIDQPTLNPMVFHQLFPHITEQIFKIMDDKQTDRYLIT